MNAYGFLFWMVFLALAFRAVVRSNRHETDSSFTNLTHGLYVGPWKKRFLILPRYQGWLIGPGYERRVVQGVSFDTALVTYEVRRELC